MQNVITRHGQEYVAPVCADFTRKDPFRKAITMSLERFEHFKVPWGVKTKGWSILDRSKNILFILGKYAKVHNKETCNFRTGRPM